MSSTETTPSRKKKTPKEFYPEAPLPPSVRRRRRTSLYRHSAKSELFDKVLIGFAVLIAFVMVSTRGCDRSIKGLTKLFTADDQASTPQKDELKHDEH